MSMYNKYLSKIETSCFQFSQAGCGIPELEGGLPVIGNESISLSVTDSVLERPPPGSRCPLSSPAIAVTHTSCFSCLTPTVYLISRL